MLGLTVDAQLEEDLLDGQPHIWTLSALASKYLHVLHSLMNQFQIRYPGSEGIRRLDMVDGKITPLLDLIRNRSDTIRESVFDLYVNKKLPLALIGRALGGDEMWLAQRIRDFGLNIETCSGAPAETAAALALMSGVSGSAPSWTHTPRWFARTWECSKGCGRGSDRCSYRRASSTK